MKLLTVAISILTVATTATALAVPAVDQSINLKRQLTTCEQCIADFNTCFRNSSQDLVEDPQAICEESICTPSNNRSSCRQCGAQFRAC